MDHLTTTVNHHPSPPPTPVTITDPNSPYPTTFIQADPTSFKQVVQMLTGTTRPIDPHHIPPIKKPSKLYERRSSSLKKMTPLLSGSTRMGYYSPETLSPSVLDFPALVLSPVTPLLPDPFSGGMELDHEAEEKAIKEKGFYLHKSPVNSPRMVSEPRLLPLFPVTSPRVSGGPSSSS